MRLLLIEDDVKLASFIMRGLRETGFAVDHSQDGEDGLHLAITESYDAIIVDIMLPKKDGFSVVASIRKLNMLVPILILSAKKSVEEKVKGLTTGSDDYLTKPFAFAELLARIHALIRRKTNLATSHKLEVGDLILDRISHQVKRCGRDITLKPKEFSILEYLMRHEGEVVTRTMLMENTWDFQFETMSNLVDVYICRLRDKIDRDFQDKMIHTLRGVGYVLKNP